MAGNNARMQGVLLDKNKEFVVVTIPNLPFLGRATVWGEWIEGETVQASGSENFRLRFLLKARGFYIIRFEEFENHSGMLWKNRALCQIEVIFVHHETFL